TGITQAEANSQKASTYRDAAKEAVATTGAAVTEAAATAVIFKGISKAGEAISVRLEIEGHAAQRMAERGVSLEKVQQTVATGERFAYFHEGTWKVGFYDRQSRTFVAAAAGKVRTVINNVKPQYIENLKKLTP